MKLEIIDIYKDESYVPTEPILLPEAKAWCLVDFTDDDALITSLIPRARKTIEKYCHISITPRTISLTAKYCPPNYGDAQAYNYRWDAQFYGWPSPQPNDWMELPYGPVASVQSVTRIDPNGTVTILNQNSDYFLSGVSFKNIRFNSWADQLLIIYFTPYYMPDELKEAILAEIAFGYKNRGAGVNRYANQNVGVSERAQALAAPFVRRWL